MNRAVATAPSKRVAYLRWLFPVLCFVLLGLLMIWPQVERVIALSKATTPLIDKQTAEEAVRNNRLTDAVYTDTDAKDRQFEVRAQQAMQAQGMSGAVTLDKPMAKLVISPDRTIKAWAANGLYQQDIKVLILTGGVVLERTDVNGISALQTEKLQLNLSKNTAHTHLPVVVTTPDARLTGQSMLVLNDGDDIYLGGPVHMRWSEK